MPNWTDVTLECEGLSDLPIFTEFEKGKPELDYNKIVPMPDYVRDTISPVRTNTILCYLFSEFPEAEAREKVKEMGLNVDAELLSRSAEDIVFETNDPEHLGFGDDAREISAYDLGKNYVTAKETTGSWDWYDWAYDNWGVKWNASDSYLDGNKVSFMAPWGYPDKIFEKLAEMFPEKDFYSEIIYEDEYDSIHTIDFSANHWDEGVEPNPGYLEETFDNLEFRLGLYNQRNAAYPEEMEESKAYGIAIQAMEDGEPYTTCTVNLPNLYGDFCEFIGIKNAAYMDTNNCPWVTQFLEQGIAVDTGFTKRSGFCEYPLYQFNEEWLKSLKPALQYKTYDDYEKKYNQVMGIEAKEPEINEHVVWQDTYFMSEKDKEEILDELAEEYPDYSEDKLFSILDEDNKSYLGDEKFNLDVQLGQPIICIGDIGRWNGRSEGYLMIDSCNLADCLDVGEDYNKFFVDEDGEFRGTGIHHDGTNHYQFRVFRDGVGEDGIEALQDAIYNGKLTDEILNKYTRKLGDDIQKVYGFEKTWNDEVKNMNVDYIKEKYPAGTRVILQNMEGESQMPAGLKGTVTSVDDIGQIHVSWENGSSLAINPEVDSFAVDNSKEFSIRPLTEQERDYTYTQEKHILEDAGCVGHLRVDMDTNGKGFYTDWSDHVHELNDSRFKKDFDHIINELRDNPQYGNMLTDRDSLKKYCYQHADEARFGDEHLPAYGFRVDDENWSCLLRLDPSPGNYAAYVYAYDKDMLDNHLEDMKNREKITVLEIAPGKEPKTVELFSDLSSLQAEVGGLIECIYPWEDNAGIICNEEGKIMGLPLNRAMRDDEGNIYDVIAGTMLVVGLTEDNFGSLTPEQIGVYSEMFKEPETILLVNGEVTAFPTKDYFQVPVYLEGAEHAKENGELDVYRASFRTNVACKKAIEESLSDHYSDNHLDSKAVYDEVTAVFGEDRVKMVLANTCNEKDWDARVSRENKEWAKTIPVPDGNDSFGGNNNNYFICERPHIGLVNLLCDRARKGPEKVKEEKRESALDKLDKAKEQVKAKPEKAANAKKKDQSIE